MITFDWVIHVVLVFLLQLDQGNEADLGIRLGVLGSLTFRNFSFLLGFIHIVQIVHNVHNVLLVIVLGLENGGVEGLYL